MHIDPRMIAPIATSTSTLLEFTPDSLDPLAQFERERPMLDAEIRKAGRSLAAARAAGADTSPEQVGRLESEADAAEARLAMRRQAARDAADEIAERGIVSPPVFLLAQPSASDREKLNMRLMQLGLTTISQEQIRASMIEAIFEVDWGKGDENDSHRDELANFLDGIWQREMIQMQAFDAWREQEAERILDELNGAPPRQAEMQPPRVISVRDEAKAVLLTQTLTDTPRMRDIIARRLDYDRANAVLAVRLQLRGIAGESILSPVCVDARTDAVPEAQVLSMQQELEDMYGARRANDAWLELVARVNSLFALDGFERGNSDSPRGKQSDPTGSDAPSGDTGINGGCSTTSSTEAPPAGESATTTARSSGSIFEVAAPTARSFPTAVD